MYAVPPEPGKRRAVQGRSLWRRLCVALGAALLLPLVFFYFSFFFARDETGASLFRRTSIIFVVVTADQPKNLMF